MYNNNNICTVLTTIREKGNVRQAESLDVPTMIRNRNLFVTIV